MDLGSIPATIRHTNTEGVGNDGMFTYSADLQANKPSFERNPNSSGFFKLHSARGGQAKKTKAAQ